MAARNAELATEAENAREKADARSESLAAQVRSNTIERARVLGHAGNLRAAEEILWPMQQERPDAQSGWALWDVYTQMPCIATLARSNAEIWALAVSPDERTFATGDESGQLVLWSLHSLSPVASMKNAHASSVRALSFARDNSTLLTAGADGTLSAWSAIDGIPLRTTQLGAPIMSIAAFETFDGRSCVAAACRDGLIRVVDVTDFKTTRTLSAGPAGQYAVSADRSGRFIAAGGADGSVRLWNSHSDSPMTDFKLESGAAISVAMSLDGSRLAIGGGPSDRWIRTWSVNPESGTLTAIASNQWKNGTVRSVCVTIAIVTTVT
jgi:WD40 repeat protein